MDVQLGIAASALFAVLGWLVMRLEHVHSCVHDAKTDMAVMKYRLGKVEMVLGVEKTDPGKLPT